MTADSVPAGSLKRRITAGSAVVFSGRIVTLVATFLVNVLLARILTPSELGAYFLIFSLASIIAMLAQLGLNRVVLRKVGEAIGLENPESASRVVRAIFGIALLSFVGFSAISAFAVPLIAVDLFSSELVQGATLYVIGWTAVLMWQNLAAETFRAFGRYTRATLFGGLITALVAVVIFLGVWFGGGASDLYSILLLTILAGFLNTVIALFLMKRFVAGASNPDSGLRKEIFRITWSFLGVGVATLFINQVGIWIVGAYFDEDQVALYGVAFRVASLVALPLVVINRVIAPIISELYSGGKKKQLEAVLRKLATATSLFAALSFLVFVIFGRDILSLAFGEFYAEAALLLTVIGAGMLFSVIVGSCGELLLMSGHQTTMLRISVFVGVITTVAALIVAPYGQLELIAAALAFGLILKNILMVFLAKRHTGVWTFVALVSPIPKLRDSQ